MTKLTESHGVSHFYKLNALLYLVVWVEDWKSLFVPINDVIAGSVSQNCGRQPHIVSTNHSNLIAVGPNRSLASRQAIVWTYRPRVEATESQPPDFLRSESYTDGKKSERALLRDFPCPVLEFKQETGRKIAKIAFKKNSKISNFNFLF